MKTAVYESPLGKITLAADEGALIGLWFDGQKYDRAGLHEGLELPGDETVLERAAQWLNAYFKGECREADFLLSPRGSDFQKRVWRELLNIRPGTTASYGEIADKIGCRSARAVGSAIGRNPISIIIPCHRVVGADGSLTGYAGGTERKRMLLSLELDKAQIR